jgi:hypothetical protein
VNGRALPKASGDTGQSRRVPDFLLAWWNASECGGYDLTDGWGVDESTVEAMCVVFRLATRANSCPDVLGYAREFEARAHAWRPNLASTRGPLG